jgi:tetratricopeptide (TPR) repeat protein
LWWGRHRWGRGPLVAVLLFAGTLLPALGFFDVFPMMYSYVADHFQYLAFPALIALAVGFVSTQMTRLHVPARLTQGAGAGVLLLLALLTWQQSHVYHDSITLWRDTVAKNPNCYMAFNNLANCLVQQGDLAQAVPLYQQALRINESGAPAPFAETARLDQQGIGTQSNLGMALAALGRLDESRSSFQAALRIAPESAQLHFNYGMALFKCKQYGEAEAEFRAAIRYSPQHLLAQYNLASSLYMQHRVAEAEQEYLQALAIDPQSALVHQELGVLLLDRHDAAGAAEHFRVCVEQESRNPLFRILLAKSLDQAGRRSDALLEVQRALEIHPQLESARRLLTELRR